MVATGTLVPRNSLPRISAQDKPVYRMRDDLPKRTVLLRIEPVIGLLKIIEACPERSRTGGRKRCGTAMSRRIAVVCISNPWRHDKQEPCKITSDEADEAQTPP